jgi:hypothetical protein
MKGLHGPGRHHLTRHSARGETCKDGERMEASIREQRESADGGSDG